MRWPCLTTVACVALSCVATAGCAQQPRAPSPAPATPATARDSSSSALVPTGFGTLRQEDIAVKIDVPDVEVWLVPLDESVIRVLSPDSYRQLEGLVESQRDRITRLAAVHSIRNPSVWYVRFSGLAPEARFTPTDVTITSLGRDYRPADIIPLSSGFGAQRVRARESQTALYLFEDGVDVAQPLTVSMGAARNDRWGDILRTIERERAIIRSRARQTR